MHTLAYITSMLLLTLTSLLPSTHAQDADTNTNTPQPSTAAITELTTMIATPSTVTTYVLSATTPPSPQYTDPLSLRTSILNSTNLYRYQHNATFLAWNDSLATYASSYARKCIWAHSLGPPGENLARGYPDILTAVDAWGNERAMYTFSPESEITGFTEATGHFTQLVWKSTQTVGCAVYACNGENGVAGYMLVCEYWPPGNIEGTGRERNVFFEENVQGQVVEGEDGFDVFSATVGASGVGTATATGTLVPTAEVGSGAGVVRRSGCMELLLGVLGLGVGGFVAF